MVNWICCTPSSDDIPDRHRAESRSRVAHLQNRRRVEVALLVAVLLCAGSVLQARAATTWPVRPGAMQRWAPGNMAWDAGKVMTQSIAVSVARSYDMVMGTGTTFRGHVPAMRAANPNLRL